MLKTGTRFSLRDKRLLEITEFEITRVDCIFIRNSIVKQGDVLHADRENRNSQLHAF